MIRGEVHDENAWSLGGVAGHAGLFSTARDLAVLARTLLNGGRYGHARILDEDTVRAMLVNENSRVPRRTRTGSASSSTSGGTWTACPRPSPSGTPASPAPRW